MLKSIKPGVGWKKSNRDLLVVQIGFDEQISEVKIGVIEELVREYAYQLRVFVARPAVFVFVLAFAALGSFTLASGGINSSKPGDSFYIAKIVSEKAQLALTFNDIEKAKLGLEFAENRTREIARVLVDFNKDKLDKDNKVQRLTNDFKDEINKIKEYNVVASGKNENLELDEQNEAEFEINDTSIDNLTVTDAQVTPNDDDQKVFSAYLGKVSKGIQLQENNTNKDLHKVLDDATELIENKDYVGTLNKLEEASAIIEIEENAIIVENSNDQIDSEINEIVELLQSEQEIVSTSSEEALPVLDDTNLLVEDEATSTVKEIKDDVELKADSRE